jgi:hypothetical protein
MNFDISFDNQPIEFDVGTIDLSAFEIDMSQDSQFSSRYVKPKIRPERTSEQLSAKNAKDLVRSIKLEPGMRAFCIVDGSFIFGDFIEFLITENKLFIRNLWINTLSMSIENVDSLYNLLNWRVVLNLNLIVSAYFFAHERHGIIKAMYDCLDIDDRFQLAVASSHCKTVCMETHDGKKYVIHGSANMRSSSNLEQFMIEQDDDLFDFTIGYQERILEAYKTIDKSVRRSKLWQAVASQAE